MKHILLAGLVSFSLVTSAQAGPIMVDPGTVGSSFSPPTFTVNSADFSNNSFDLVFSDSKNVKLSAGLNYTIGLSGSDFNLNAVQFYLSDEFGQMIPGTTLNGTAHSAGYGGGVITPQSDIVFSDIHFTFTNTAPSVPFTGTLFVVGPNALVGQSTPVPEPSTFALLGIGGLALVGYGWRRKRQQAA